MNVACATAPRRYTAFLSYRHADNRDEGRRWAEWLHQLLETYEVPRDLVGKINRRGDPIPATLYPVFRDEVELPADAELSQPIRHALENSSTLIVLCSPRACDSQFVAEEIRYFKELGKADRILALIIDGEPNADDAAKVAAGITPEMECFPAHLRCGRPNPDGTIDWTVRTEPVAPDVRPQNLPRQGFTTAAAYRKELERSKNLSNSELRRLEKSFGAQLELAKFKLISGIIGISLDQITRRDAKFRARRFRRLAIFATIVTIASIAGGITVWNERNKAETARALTEIARQKAETAGTQAINARGNAERLVAFMLFDLNEKLTAIGKQSLLSDVDQQVADYFSKAGTNAEGGADGTRLRATSLLREGDLRSNNGDHEGALLAYRQANSIFKRFADENPPREPPKYDYGVSQNRIGGCLLKAGRVQEAVDFLSETQLYVVVGLGSLEVSGVSDGPVHDRWRESLAANSKDLALALGIKGRRGEEIELLVKASAIFKELLDLSPENMRLATRWVEASSSLAFALLMANQAAESAGIARPLLPTLDQLKERAAGDVDALESLSAYYFMLYGVFKESPDDADLALHTAKSRVSIWEAVANTDTENRRWQDSLAGSRLTLCELQTERGELNEALQTIEAVAKIGLNDADKSEVLSLPRRALSAHKNLASLALKMSRPEAAASHASEAIRICGELKGDSGAGSDIDVDLFVVSVQNGLARMQLNDIEGRSLLVAAKQLGGKLSENGRDSLEFQDWWTLLEKSLGSSNDGR